MNAIVSASLSLAVIGVFALAGGGLWLILGKGNRKKGLLMLVAALVLLANVLIWSLPASA